MIKLSCLNLLWSWQLLRFSLFLMTMTVLKNTCQVFCRMSQFGFDWCFCHGYASVVSFGEEDHRGEMPFLSHRISGMCYQLTVVALISWLREDLSHFSTVKSPHSPSIPYALFGSRSRSASQLSVGWGRGLSSLSWLGSVCINCSDTSVREIYLFYTCICSVIYLYQCKLVGIYLQFYWDIIDIQCAYIFEALDYNTHYVIYFVLQIVTVFAIGVLSG